jgi:hypothetical protein
MEFGTIVRASRLPVDGLHTIFELSRRSELPLSDKSPDNRNSSDARSYYDDDCNSGVFGCRSARSGLSGIGGRRSSSVCHSLIISGLTSG